LLNPTAIFCNDRERYYTLLGQADDGSLAGREAWCTYVLGGMLVELQKLARLADAGYLLERILIPALQHARQREQLTPLEERLLREAARLGVAKTSELATVAPGLSERQRTYQVSKLVERGLLMPLREGARQYTLGFASSVLLRGVVQALAQEGFIPEALQRA
jgi:Fic family protein